MATTVNNDGGIGMTRRATPNAPGRPDQFRVFIDEMDDELKMQDHLGNVQRIRSLGNLGDQFADAVDISGGSGRFSSIGYSQRGSVSQTGSKTTTVTLDNFATIDLTTAGTSIAQGVPTSFTLNCNLIGVNDQINVTHVGGGTIGGYAVNGRATGAGVGQITMTKITSGSEGALLQLIVSISGRPA